MRLLTEKALSVFATSTGGRRSSLSGFCGVGSLTIELIAVKDSNVFDLVITSFSFALGTSFQMTLSSFSCLIFRFKQLMFVQAASLQVIKNSTCSTIFGKSSNTFRISSIFCSLVSSQPVKLKYLNIE